jgi:hypothetical protein
MVIWSYNTSFIIPYIATFEHRHAPVGVVRPEEAQEVQDALEA